MEKIFEKLYKLYLKYILRKKYIRKGNCKKCGKCCQNIYIKHGGKVFSDKKVFLNFQKTKSIYREFEVIGNDELGLIFKCKNLDPNTNLCKNHKKRSIICRKYPSEDIFQIGAELSPNCGFYFIPIDSFSDVLSKVSKNFKNNIKLY